MDPGAVRGMVARWRSGAHSVLAVHDLDISDPRTETFWGGTSASRSPDGHRCMLGQPFRFSASCRDAKLIGSSARERHVDPQ